MKTRKPRRRYVAPLILAVGLGVSAFIAASEEEAPPATAVIEPPLVETMVAMPDTARLSIEAWGFVEAEDVLTLRPQVSGAVIEVAPDLVSGAGVSEGQVLFRIDPRSYRNAVLESRAAVDQAIQLLAIEKGQQNIARAELDLLKQEFPDMPADRSLALRVPQLREKEALIQLETARLRQAELDVDRTVVQAPCRGRILSEAVALGAYLEVGADGLEVACLESQRVFASFPAAARLARTVQEVTVRFGADEFGARLISVLPQIDPQTRQRVAVVEWTGRELPIGAQVEVDLPGEMFEAAFAVPTTAIRADDTVWTLSAQDRLEVRFVEILGRGQERTLVGAGLTAGDRVIVSHLSNPIDGLLVRTAETVAAAERDR